MKNTSVRVLLSIVVLFFYNCVDDSNKNKEVLSSGNSVESNVEKNVSQNLNVSFLLDLSDRIDPKKYPNPTMEFYLRDVNYIKSVSEAFHSHLQKKKVRQMNDKIQVYFDPEPLNSNINKMSDDLRFNIKRGNASLELLDVMKESYATEPELIYELAIKDNKFIGSDTWRFFKTKVKDYCIEDGYRNILVLLTDGYIYHEDTKFTDGNFTTYLTPQIVRSNKLNTIKWEDRLSKEGFGFLPATDNLENLEVLVLGINPDKKNSFEEDVLLRYWTDWLKSMNVGRFEVKTTALPSDMDKIIKDFILKS